MADTLPLSGGAPADVNAIAAADQETIGGDGTAGNPLHVLSPGSGLTAQFRAHALESPLVGMPVVATGFSPTESGVACVVTSGSAAIGQTVFQVIGVVAAVLSEDLIRVALAGAAVFTEDDWNQITLGSGGLAAGSAYYLDWGVNSFGHLTTVAPTTSGQHRVQVGVAISTATLLLSTPAVPIAIP